MPGERQGQYTMVEELEVELVGTMKWVGNRQEAHWGEEEGSCSAGEKKHLHWIEVEWAEEQQACFEPAEAVGDDVN